MLLFFNQFANVSAINIPSQNNVSFALRNTKFIKTPIVCLI